MKRILYLTILVLGALLSSCGGKQNYVGKFTDSFKNEYEIKADGSATIQFFNTEKVWQESWKEVKQNGMTYVALSFNGNPEAYILYDGKLYAGKESLEKNKSGMPIKFIK